MEFQTEKVIKTEPEVVIKKILSVLKDAGYVITQLDNIVAFERDRNSWKIVSRSDSYKKMDSGKFQFVNIENEVTLKLTYSISIIPEVILFISTLFGGFFLNYKVFFLSLFVAFIIANKILDTKKASEELLENL